MVLGNRQEVARNPYFKGILATSLCIMSKLPLNIGYFSNSTAAKDRKEATYPYPEDLVQQKKD